MKTRPALLLAALLASPVLAQTPEGPAAIIAPAFTAEPSAEAIKAGWPRQLGMTSAGFSILRCAVADEGALARCQALKTFPEQLGVEQAALGLAGQYRVARPAGSTVLFPVVFNPDRRRLDQAASGDAGLVRNLAAALTRPPRAESSLTVLGCQIADDGAVLSCQTAYETHIDPELAAYQLDRARAELYAPATVRHPLTYQTVYRVMTDNTDRARPELANAPTPDAFYPSTARDGVVGLVSLDCTIVSTGLAKDCEVRSESPAGQGFANAALQYAGRSTYLPRRIEGVEHDDQMSLDIRLAPAQEGRAPAESTTLAAASTAPADPTTATGPTP